MEFSGFKQIKNRPESPRRTNIIGDDGERRDFVNLVVVRTFVTLEGRDEKLNTLRETQSKNKGNVSKHMVGQIFFCDASIGKPKGNGQTKGNGKPKAQFMFHFSPPVR